MKGKHKEMKYIGQHDISDCGPACLAMISNYYGLKYPLQRFRDDSLSQGQKQRIGVARAILHKPKVLILDEALSNLSYENAKRIFDNISKEMKFMTIIIISHSEELVNLCDSVIEI